MSEQKDITLLKVQRELKPKIEDIIHACLDGDAKEIALEFAGYMQTIRLPLRWAGVHNAWRALYKGKAICYVKFPRDENDNERANGKWAIIPHIDHLDNYANIVLSEGLQHLIWDNMFYCMFCRTLCYGSAPGKDVLVLGKEIKSICSNRQLTWVNDPSKADVKIIKRLLQLEQQARN